MVLVYGAVILCTLEARCIVYVLIEHCIPWKHVHDVVTVGKGLVDDPTDIIRDDPTDIFLFKCLW
jgi:hypothetical protein